MEIIIIILIPLLGSIVLPLLYFNKLAYHLFLISLVISNAVLLSFHIADKQIVHTVSFITFYMDKYAWFFLIVVHVAWLITIIYSYSFDGNNFQKNHLGKFYFFLNIVISILIANGLAGNMLTMFLFYVLGVPFTYPLLTLKEHSSRIGRAYLVYILMPAFLMFLPAIVAIIDIDGWVNFYDTPNKALQEHPTLAALCLFMFVVGISKNSVIPFHDWLPKTMLAPAPVSALIHSVAAVKSGVIVLTKIIVYVYGIDFVRALTSDVWRGGWLIYLCGATAVYTAYRALKTKHLKVRFSYSTIGQLSYIIIALLVATPTSILGAMLHILTHSIAKMGLFFVAGTYNAFYNTLKTHNISKIAPHTPFLVTAVAIFGASITGFPFLAGYHSKDLMLLEDIHTGNYAAAFFLLVGSFINILYIYPIVKSGFFYKEKIPLEVKNIPIGMKIAIGICVLVVLSFSFWTYYVIRYFEAL